MYKLSTEYEPMFENAVNALSKYITESGIKSLVLGISGGVDSAIVAALAYEAVNRLPQKIPIIGRSITIESNKEGEIERAYLIGNAFCSDFKELDLTKMYFNMTGEIDEADVNLTHMEAKIALGNIKARIRMTQLYHLAGITKGMVLSTDNYTEYLLGFWTLHGDVGDYGMIQNLWKTEVYGLTNWLSCMYEDTSEDDKVRSLMSCYNAVPTDGLGITDSDLDQLGADSYDEVDEILIDYLNDNRENDHKVTNRYENTHFKRENPYNIPRKELVK